MRECIQKHRPSKDELGIKVPVVVAINDENNVKYSVVDYLNILPNKNFLKNVLVKLENNFEEIIRINEKIYKNLKIDEKAHTFENIMNLVTKYPVLMQRPIVAIERDNEIIVSIICRPTELIKSIFD